MELGPELINTPEPTYPEPLETVSVETPAESVQQDQPSVQSEPVIPVSPAMPEAPTISEAPIVAETPIVPEASVTSGATSESAIPVAVVAAATAATVTAQPFNQTPIHIDGEVRPEDVKKTHRNSLKLAILISFGLLLFLIGGSVSAYTFWYSNPKKVVYDAISNIMTADAIQMNSITTITIPSSSSTARFNINKVTLNTITTNAPSESVDLSVEVSINGSSYTVDAKGMYLDNGDIYFRLENILDSIKQAFGDQLVTQTIKDEISNLQGKWVKFSVSDMTKMSAEAAKTYQCVLDTYKTVNKDKAMQNDYVSLYEKSPFLNIDEANVQNKDGDYGYSVSIDANKFVSYTRSIGDSASMKEFNKCSTSTSSYTSSISDEEAAKSVSEFTSKLKTVVWVDQWTHKMSKIDVGYSDSESSYNVVVNTDIEVKVDDNLTVTAPESPMTYDEWVTGVNKVIQTFYSTY
jgi:hypothetical protein